MRMVRSALMLWGDGVEAATEASRAMALSMSYEAIVIFHRPSETAAQVREYEATSRLRAPPSFIIRPHLEPWRALDMGVPNFLVTL